MKFEKLTKENISDKLKELAELSNKMYLDKEENEKYGDVVKLYVQHILSIDDHFPHKRIIETVSCFFSESEIENVNKKAIRYKENGLYWCLYYHDSTDNKDYYSIDEINENIKDYHLISPNTYRVTHYHYDEDLDILLCSPYEILRQEGKPTIFAPSKYRHIVTRDKVRYVISETSYQKISWDTYSGLSNTNIDATLTNQSLLSEFTKMFKQPIMNIGANKFLTIDTYEAMMEFLSYTAKLEIKNGPKQKKIDEFTSIELPDIKSKIPNNFKGETLSTPYSKTCIQKVKENTCVIRWKLCSVHSPVECDGLRIYIEGKDIYPCKLNNNNEFIRTTISNIKPENFLSCDMEDIDKTQLKGTILEYYGEIINDIPKKYRSLVLISFVREPRIEQIFKLGLHNLIYKALENKEFDILNYVCKRLGINCDKKEKNIFKYIGVNKYQLSRYKDLINDPEKSKKLESYCQDFLKYIKTIFGEDTSSIDNKTFDDVFDGLIEYSKTACGYYRDCLNYRAMEISSIKREITNTENKNLIKHFNEILPDICKLADFSFRRYKDYIHMVSLMEDFKNFKIGFSDDEDIENMHDAANSIYNLNSAEYRAKAFKLQLKKVEKLEYENKDDDFAVVIPAEPGDLAKEGLELRHCVRSYIEKVADGQTNIVFIRKKTEKFKPFFTVEVSNDKIIEQVHGFANRDADTEPGLEDFVKRWARNKRLTVGSINKVR